MRNRRAPFPPPGKPPTPGWKRSRPYRPRTRWRKETSVADQRRFQKTNRRADEIRKSKSEKRFAVVPDRLESFVSREDEGADSRGQRRRRVLPTGAKDPLGATPDETIRWSRGGRAARLLRDDADPRCTTRGRILRGAHKVRREPRRLLPCP